VKFRSGHVAFIIQLNCDFPVPFNAADGSMVMRFIVRAP